MMIKVFSGHKRSVNCTFEFTTVVSTCTGHAQVQDRQYPSMKGRDGYEVPSIIREPLIN